MGDSEKICEQMGRVRRDLNHEVGEVVANAKRMTDWRGFVSRHPLLAVSAAAAVGLYIVPTRLKVSSPSPEALEELADHNRLVVKSKPDARRQASAVSPVLNLLVGAVTLSALTFAGQHVSRLLESPSMDQANHDHPPLNR